MVFRGILPFLLLPFLLITGGCEQQDTVVARVDHLNITRQEFTYRYMFNPYLYQIKDDQQARMVLLTALLAEKILAAEAEKNRFADSLAEQGIREHLWEAMIEQIRRDSVESQIQITPQELNQEFQQSLKTWRVKIATGPDSRKGVIEERVLTWPLPDERWEKALYAGREKQWYRLDDQQWLYIAKVDSHTPGAHEFDNRRSAIEDHCRRRKIKKRYSEFFQRQLRPRLGIANTAIIKRALKVLAREITFKPTSTALYGEWKELKEGDVKDIGSVAEQWAVRFPSGAYWTVRELFHRLKIGPYAFNYRSPRTFAQSFLRNVQLLIEHQAIYTLARQLGYENDPRVLEEVAMWRTFYRANAYRYHLLASVSGSAEADGPEQLSPLQLKRLEKLDRWLAQQFERHQIEINKKLLRQLTLKRTHMVVFKRHFAHRLMAPLTQPLTRLTRWQAKIEAVLKNES